MALETRSDRLEVALSRLAEAQDCTEEGMRRLEAAMAALAAAQARTEERVGRLEQHMDRVEAALARLMVGSPETCTSTAWPAAHVEPGVGLMLPLTAGCAWC